MFRLLCTLCLLAAVAPPADAQTFRFAGIEWGASRARVDTVLRAQGYTPLDALTPHIDALDRAFRMERPSSGRTVAVIARFTPQDELVRWKVGFVTDGDECLDLYRAMKKLLSEEYGSPDHDFRRFERPYRDGDGNAQKAIRSGHARLASYWRSDESEYLSIQVTRSLGVVMTYEGPRWAAEHERRGKGGESVNR